jgi:2-polyprenyl-3-methyl-5-hydroxy-6-metoxy-1,4-benzoquinol methylase
MKSEKLGRVHRFPYKNVNIEETGYPDRDFDVALLCEVIEHLTADPLNALRNIAASLKPDALLIVSTPNVNRLENVARMVSGENIYDPFSAYGIYGRHNREYNKHELFLMLRHLGFKMEALFTADVHPNHSDGHCDVEKLRPLLEHRINDLGQYIFLAARKESQPLPGKLPWLYRSYPPDAYYSETESAGNSQAAND